jgi:hypothetical protein
MKTLLPLAAFAGLAFAATSAHAAVVYQDNFDSDTIATNTGIGGGLGAYERQGGPWIDSGTDLDFNRSGSNDRANVYSLNTFNLTGGFKLEVTHSIDDITTSGSDRAVIGLLDAADLPASQDNGSYVTDFLNRDLGQYGIGMDLTNGDSTHGLNFSDGTDLNELSNAQTITTGTQSWVLEVDAAGNWSYSIDGATATTGTSAFDVTRNYHFFAYAQDNDVNLVIHSAKLTVVPEPSTTALLGLGGLALILRRRK